jgi:DNA-damage-inducible protein J
MERNVNLNVRINNITKHNAETILKKLGISTTDAINIFFNQLILERGLPFAVKLPREKTPEEHRKGMGK